MNNKTAQTIREKGMMMIFDNIINKSELIQIDTGKFVFPVYEGDNILSYCEIDFIAKKEDYTPNYDLGKFAEKTARMEKAQKELQERKQKKAQKTVKKSE